MLDIYIGRFRVTLEGVLILSNIILFKPKTFKQSNHGRTQQTVTTKRIYSQMHDSLAYYAHRCFGPASPDHRSICDPGIHRCQDFESPFLVINV